MSFLSGLLLYRKISCFSIQSNRYSYSLWSLLLHPNSRTQWFSSGAGSATQTEFLGENAYDILGVTENSSFAEIKASFRKLAKETHPDLAESKNVSSESSKSFVRILAAFEILSDSEKRAHYDSYLLSQRMVVHEHSRKGSTLYSYTPHMTINKQMEVVEWLKWYRLTINDIVSQRKAVVGTGYFDVLEADFYSAIQTAYYGPVIESMDLLPDRFEAEERSVYETPEVKHMHWYRVREEVSVCECRCGRARLPPSKFWLFEPRCGMHDIGGWYIKTFGRDKKGRTVLSQRYWDGVDAAEQFDERLHPAIYLLALAYRTLDIEDAKIRK